MEKFMDLSAEQRLGSVLLFLLLLLLFALHFSKNARIRRKIKNGKLIYYKDFEKNWRGDEKKGRPVGYKYNDRPGCYVITLYDHRFVTKRNYMKYENIYIGQSQNVCQRVHNHLNGKGKGDVYADIKYGMEAYIRILPCKEKKMNELERELIGAFNATESYNVTRGGGKDRRKRR